MQECILIPIGVKGNTKMSIIEVYYNTLLGVTQGCLKGVVEHYFGMYHYTLWGVLQTV